METLMEKITQLCRGGATRKQLIAALPEYEEKQVLAAVDQLCGGGVLIRNKRGALSPIGERGLQKATFCATGREFSFAAPEDGGEDFFVPPGQGGGAWQGDSVLIRVSQGHRGRQQAKVVKVLPRKLPRLTGQLVRQKSRLALLPDNKKFPEIAIGPGKTKGQPGDKVFVQVTSFGDEQKAPTGRVLQVLGRQGTRQSAIAAALCQAGIRQAFPQAVESQCAGFASAVRPQDLTGRMDLRGDIIFTIDGAHSQDFDDAVSLSRTGDGWLLGVHIADVSHYVTEDSPLDKEALLRGTSLYYADQVIPMLPLMLSHGLCSLVEGEDRLTISCLMAVDESGEVQDFAFHPSVICSRARLTYDGVNAFLAGEEEAVPQAVRPALKDLAALALKLHKRRMERGAIEPDLPEGEIVCDEKGEPVAVRQRRRGASERLIEECMVLANEAAARCLTLQDYPGVYRVHGAPDPDKLAAFAAFARKKGYQTPKSDQLDGPALEGILAQARTEYDRNALSMLLVRSQARARYDESCSGHWALALSHYLHFTSPIRRYPDLMVHRLLHRLMAGDKPQPQWRGVCQMVAVQSSETERAAEAVSRQIEKYYVAQTLEGQEGQEFDAMISGVQNFGVFCQLDNTIEGLCRTDALPPDQYQLDDSGQSLVGAHHTFMIGDGVKVRLEKADAASGQIDFTIVR